MFDLMEKSIRLENLENAYFKWLEDRELEIEENKELEKELNEKMEKYWKDAISEMYNELSPDLKEAIEAMKVAQSRKEYYQKQKAFFDKKRKQEENKEKGIKTALENILIKHNRKKFQLDDYTLSIQKNPASVEIFDENLIPSCYIKKIEYDKKLIKEEIKAGGEIEGARLVQSESLRIK